MRAVIVAFACGLALAAVWAQVGQSDTGIVLYGSRIGESFGGYRTQAEQDAASFV
jgi:hypothetical protein